MRECLLCFGLRSPVADLRPEAPPAAVDDEQERVEHDAGDEGGRKDELQRDYGGHRYVTHRVIDIQWSQSSLTRNPFIERRLSAMHSQTRLSSLWVHYSPLRHRACCHRRPPPAARRPSVRHPTLARSLAATDADAHSLRSVSPWLNRADFETERI